jgi:hypothetical protein
LSREWLDWPVDRVNNWRNLEWRIAFDEHWCRLTEDTLSACAPDSGESGGQCKSHPLDRRLGVDLENCVDDRNNVDDPSDRHRLQ